MRLFYFILWFYYLEVCALILIKIYCLLTSSLSYYQMLLDYRFKSCIFSKYDYSLSVQPIVIFADALNLSLDELDYCQIYY